MIESLSMTRVCTKCQTPRAFPETFCKDTSKPSGYRPICKVCDALARPKYKGRYKARYRYKQIRNKGKEATYRRNYLARRRSNDEGYRQFKAAHDRRYRTSPAGQIAKKRAKAYRKAREGQHSLSSAEWQAVLVAFDNRCAYCFGTTKPLTLDHFIPLYRQGNTVLGNVLPSCVHCNSSKQHKMPSDWCSPEQYRRVQGILQSI